MQVIVDKGKYVLLKTGFYIKSYHRLIYDNDKYTCHFHNKHLISSENKNVLKPRNSSMWRHTIHKLRIEKIKIIYAEFIHKPIRFQIYGNDLNLNKVFRL